MDTGIKDYDAIKTESGLGENEDETSPTWKDNLKKQLEIQKKLYTFFGTGSKEEIEKFLMFVPKGSIFFHGDNANEGEIKYTKIRRAKRVENKSVSGEMAVETELSKPKVTQEELNKKPHTYEIEEETISLDQPVIRIQTSDSNGKKIDNMITQPHALLAKAGNLRLTACIVNANKMELSKYEKIIDPDKPEDEKLMTSTNKQPIEELVATLKKIEELVTIVYDFSESGLARKQKYGYCVFKQDWAIKTGNEKYIFYGKDDGKKKDPKKKEEPKKPVTCEPKHWITDEVIEQKKEELDKILSDLQTAKSDDIVYQITGESAVTTESKKKIVTQFYLNAKSAAELSSKPEDVLLKPPSKTQMFGNPCAETNIALMKGTTPVPGEEVKTDAKYLYSMQVYMFQNDIYLLDYAKLKSNEHKLKDVTPVIDKRSMFWGNYFKTIDDDDIDDDEQTKTGLYTDPFPITTNIQLTQKHTYDEKTYKELTDSYTVDGKKIKTYSLRNYQPKEDSPVISHLNFILGLRGFPINIQGFTDYDLAEKYPMPAYKHPDVEPLFYHKDFMVKTDDGNIMTREFNIYNTPKNLIYLCYSSTLPNYNLPSLPNTLQPGGIASKIGLTEGDKLFDHYFVTIVDQATGKPNEKTIAEYNANYEAVLTLTSQKFADFGEKDGVRTPPVVNVGDKVIYKPFFGGEHKSLLIMNNEIANPKKENEPTYGEENMFVDFTHPALFEEKAKYEKGAINIMKNSFIYKKKAMKIMKTKYLNGPDIDEKDDKGRPIVVNYPWLSDLQEMLDEERVRENIYGNIFSKIEDLGFKMVNNLNDTGAVNMFRGFKLVKSDDTPITDIEMSNFINNINAGLIDTYPSVSDPNDNPLLSQNIMVYPADLEPELIRTHSTTKPRHFEGFIEDLLKYYYHSCTEENCDMSKMARQIMSNPDPNVKKYLERINKESKTHIQQVEELMKSFGIELSPAPVIISTPVPLEPVTGTATAPGITIDKKSKIGRGAFKTVYSCKLTETTPLFTLPQGTGIDELCIAVVHSNFGGKEYNVEAEIALHNELFKLNLAPKIYEFKTIDNTYYILQERCGDELTKTTFVDYIKADPDNKNYVLSKTLELIFKIADNGYIHLDIKPDNTCTRVANGDMNIVALDFDPKFFKKIDATDVDNAKIFMMTLLFGILGKEYKIFLQQEWFPNELQNLVPTSTNITNMLTYFNNNPNFNKLQYNPISQIKHYLSENVDEFEGFIFGP